MDNKQIVELFAEQIDTGRSYSGRGMMGKQCFGIVGEMSECMRAIALVINAMVDECFDEARDVDDASEADLQQMDKHQSEVQDWIKTLLKFETDSMGYRDVIMYWKNIPYEEKEEESTTG